jgi:hypothetical protein
MEWAPTAENPLQVVACRPVMAAKEKGRNRENATGAVSRIEGIMVRSKVKMVKTKDKSQVQTARGCCTACCVRSHPVVGTR